MVPDRFRRLDFAVRMAVALLVLAALSLAVGATAVAVVGLFAWLVAVIVTLALEVTVLGLLVGEQFAVVGWLLDNPWPVVAVAGLLALPVLYLRPVTDEIRRFHEELGAVGTPASERDPEIAQVAGRLAQQADVAQPTVHIANRSRPESYAFGGQHDGTVVLTRGLVRALSDRELAAVLAHEISHLANGDSRVLNAALVPLLVAEHVGADERPKFTQRQLIEPLSYLAHLLLWAAVAALTRVQAITCRLGISALSRGREVAADRGAARLTGDPGALASALRELDGGRGTPSEDKRVWAKSASVLDILPTEDEGGPVGLFRTHPPTERRIDYLQDLVRETAGP